MLKRAMLGVDRDPDITSTLSLRIAGTSALANRGVPDHFIWHVGRRKSPAFLAYIRLAPGERISVPDGERERKADARDVHGKVKM